MRCFVAINLNDGVRMKLTDLQRELQKKVNLGRGEVKWVEPGKMHLTLKFLGDVRDNQIGEICEAVEGAADKHKGFEFAVNGLGFFGRNSARVLWIGAGEDAPELASLQKDVEDVLAQAGWAKEARAFASHLTLCRVKSFAAGKKLAEITREYEALRFGSVYVDSIYVYESQLTPAGPIYTVLSKSRLQ